MELLGILSALLTLAAFMGNQYGYLSNDNIWYDSMNLVSGAGLFIYAIATGALPFMITNSVWTVVSGIDVIKYFLGHRPHKTHVPRMN